MLYLIRTAPEKFAAIVEGKENTLLIGKNDCMHREEVLHFVEMVNGERTGNEVFARIERIYEKRLIQYRIYKTRVNQWRREKWNSKRPNGYT